MGSKRGSAVPIVNIEAGKLRIRLNDLLPILEKVGDLPLAIMSVNGPVRTGKSYLLGHFMRFLGAQGKGDWIHETLIDQFEWNGSAEHQTTGILVWSEPFIQNKDDRQIAVLLIDTQGSFDENADYSVNYMLFALSCLLSSVLVYNIMHQMSEDVWQFLHTCLDFARMTLEKQVDEPFTSLVMLIRDWQYRQSYDYGYHDKDKPEENNFMKEKMKARDHMDEDAKIAHAAVLRSFQSVACCLLPYPGKGLATEGKTDDLDKDFLTAIEEFVPRVCAAENTVLKIIGGQVITGSIMGGLVKTWDKLFDKLSFDDIKPLANYAAQKQNQKAMHTATICYKKHMDAIKSRSGITKVHLTLLHDKARGEAIKIFKNQKRMNYPSIEEEFREILNKQIESAYESFQEMNSIFMEFEKLEAQSEEDKIHLQQEMKAAVEREEKKMEENAKREKEARETLEKKHREEMEERIKSECDEIKRQHKDEMEERLKQQCNEMKRDRDEMEARLKREFDEMRRQHMDREDHFRKKQKDMKARLLEEKEARLKREEALNKEHNEREERLKREAELNRQQYEKEERLKRDEELKRQQNERKEQLEREAELIRQHREREERLKREAELNRQQYEKDERLKRDEEQKRQQNERKEQLEREAELIRQHSEREERLKREMELNRQQYEKDERQKRDEELKRQQNEREELLNREVELNRQHSEREERLKREYDEMRRQHNEKEERLKQENDDLKKEKEKNRDKFITS